MRRFPVVEIKIALPEGDVSTNAYQVGALAVHPMDGKWPEFPKLAPWWVVTHSRSGLRLPGVFETKEDAAGCAMALVAIIDFDDYAASIAVADGDAEDALIEAAGRVCYKSEDRISDGSAAVFIERLHASKHESVLEHGAITVQFVCDRGVTHELVRHRIASFSQESTRYCNYSKDKFGNEITVIRPLFFAEGSACYKAWVNACEYAESAYFNLLDDGATPQEARSVLPNSLKTEIVVTANPREWLHIFRLRTAPTAHPQMRELMIPLADLFRQRWPAIFGAPE